MSNGQSRDPLHTGQVDQERERGHECQRRSRHRIQHDHQVQCHEGQNNTGESGSRL